MSYNHNGFITGKLFVSVCKHDAERKSARWPCLGVQAHTLLMSLPSDQDVFRNSRIVEKLGPDLNVWTLYSTQGI